MNRYHIMRNRGYMARYFMTYGDFRPLVFGLGTVLTAAEGIIRLVMVDREHLKTWFGTDCQGAGGTRAS